MVFKPYKISDVTCRDLTFEGRGVVKYKDQVIFVTSFFPGEKGEIEVTSRRNGFLYGKVSKLDEVSPFRIQPKCKICTSCGGCVFQQYDYQKQLEYKTKKVEEQLRKIGKITAKVQQTIGMDNPFNYRNKIQVPFRRDNKGHIVYGFFKENTHELIPVKKCYIEDERAERILDAVKQAMIQTKTAPYDEDKQTGLIRDVLIRTSYYNKQIMVVLVTNGSEFPGRNNFVKLLLSSCPEITTIVQNDNHRKTNVILGEKERVLFGKGFIEDSLCGLKYKISAKSFYQINPQMTEKLYQFAINLADLQGNETVFDSYSGIGTIGLTAAKYCKEVVSAEIVKEAVCDAKQNAKNNNISNLLAYCEDATEYIEFLAANNKKIDVLFMDPPRKGSTERFLSAVKLLSPRKIIYISCEPSTLARDLAYLVDSYKIDIVQPFDMFPQTFHVETVVRLYLKEK